MPKKNSFDATPICTTIPGVKHRELTEFLKTRNLKMSQFLADAVDYKEAILNEKVKNVPEIVIPLEIERILDFMGGKVITKDTYKVLFKSFSGTYSQSNSTLWAMAGAVAIGLVTNEGFKSLINKLYETNKSSEN